MLPLNMLNDTLSIWTSLPVCVFVSAVSCLPFLLPSGHGALSLMFKKCADHACVALYALERPVMFDLGYSVRELL